MRPRSIVPPFQGAFWAEHQHWGLELGLGGVELAVVLDACEREFYGAKFALDWKILAAAGFTPERALLLDYVAWDTGLRWQVWRWATLAPRGRLAIWLEIAQVGGRTKIVPCYIERQKRRRPHIKIDREYTAELLAWPELADLLSMSCVADHLTPGTSKISCSRLIAGMQQDFCRWDRSAPDTVRREVAHLNQVSIDDRALNLRVMTHDDHTAWDDRWKTADAAAFSAWYERQQAAEYEKRHMLSDYELWLESMDDADAEAGAARASIVAAATIAGVPPAEGDREGDGFPHPRFMRFSRPRAPLEPFDSG